MKNTIKILTIIIIFLITAGCSAKKIDVIEKPTLLSTLKKELNLKLDSNLSSKKEINNYIKIDFPNETFHKGSSIPIEATDKLKEITNILKDFPTIIVQINTYSNNLPTKEENIDLANNRAFNIAEILDSFQIKNEIFAKGYQIKKDKKLEIFLYENIQDMSEHNN